MPGISIIHSFRLYYKEVYKDLEKVLENIQTLNIEHIWQSFYGLCKGFVKIFAVSLFRPTN